MDMLSCEPLRTSALLAVAACLCCTGRKGTSADTAAGAAESARSTASASAGATSPQAAPTASSSPAPTARWCDSVPRREFTGLRRVPVRSDWYLVYAVDSGVFALTEPYQYQEAISYLILGDTAALLFDTGMGIQPIQAVVKELTSLPVTVLNSHTHFDHVGGNADFPRILALDKPYTRANARGFPHEVVAGEVAPDALCRPLPAGFDSATYHTRAWKATRRIGDGYRVQLGGRTIEVLEVPGHTPDAVALLDRRNGLLWTGDTFYEAPIWLYVPETDLDAYEASIARLVKIAPSVRKLLGAHNVSVSDPQLLVSVQKAIADVRAGRVTGVDKGENRIFFPFGRFSILTSKPLLEKRHGDDTRGGSGLDTWHR